MQDLRYAVRMLRSHPGFTITAVLSLALGIGANTAIFSLIDALMLRMLPVRDPQQLMQITLTQAGRRTDSFSYPAIRALQDQADVFSSLCGFSSASYNTGKPANERVSGAWVTGSFYQTLGVEPVIGRVLTQEDDKPGGGSAGPVAVISYNYWERNFRKDPRVLGTPLVLDGKLVTVVGVAPRGFSGANVGDVADITLPLAALAQLSPEGGIQQLSPGSNWLRVLARPKHGVSRAQASAQLAVLWPRIARSLSSPQMSPERRQVALTSVADVEPGGTGWSVFRRQFTKPLLVLMAIVALVLLIACANVANLLLARATARQREIAVRLAIGASRARIIRQLLTESVLLAGIGGALGVLFAYAGSRVLVSMLSTGRTTVIALDVHPDLRVLAFTCAVALVTGILFGLAPAFRATAEGPGPALNQNVRGSGGSRSWLGPALVVSQVALSLVLLIGSGLFVRSLQNLQNLDAGFHHEGVLLIDLDPRTAGYKDARLASLYEEVLERVGRLPGVKAVSLSLNTPLSGGVWSNDMVVQGLPAPAVKESAHMNAVAPRYFETMGTPLLLGRDFTLRDNAAGPPVAIVNEAFVRDYLRGTQPLGRHLSVQHSSLWHDMEVVGVVRDAVSFTLRNPAPPAVYVPYFQDRRGSAPATIEVLEGGSLTQVTSAVRQSIQSRLPDTPLRVHTLTEQVNRSLIQERLLASLASFFGMLALGLAAVGLYGLMAYGVTRRTGEIGVRMALGARSGSVLWLILRGTLRLVAAGIMLGLPISWAASRLVASMLFGLTTTDPPTIAAATAILVAVASVAGFLPARRASRVDPIVALRYE